MGNTAIRESSSVKMDIRRKITINYIIILLLKLYVMVARIILVFITVFLFENSTYIINYEVNSTHDYFVGHFDELSISLDSLKKRNLF